MKYALIATVLGLANTGLASPILPIPTATKPSNPHTTFGIPPSLVIDPPEIFQYHKTRAVGPVPTDLQSWRRDNGVVEHHKTRRDEDGPVPPNLQSWKRDNMVMETPVTVPIPMDLEPL